MAANFKISVHRRSRLLQLKLSGKFDGSSALQLVGLLQKLFAKGSRIQIHTEGIREVHPFGRNTFAKHLPLLTRQGISISLAGQCARMMLPECGRAVEGVSISEA